MRGSSRGEASLRIAFRMLHPWESFQTAMTLHSEMRVWVRGCRFRHEVGARWTGPEVALSSDSDSNFGTCSCTEAVADRADGVCPSRGHLKFNEPSGT